jgi:hypothetical protein
MRSYLFILSFLVTFSHAQKADVLKAVAHCNPYGSCNFEVTIRHADEGWKHFANAYDIVTLEGKVLATRILHHPHINEQPFTRSISNVKIPKGVKSVIIRANDLLHGYGGKEIHLQLYK